MPSLNLRKIKVLVTVAETRSATLAGQRLHLGQSAVSQTLKELQEDLGITLFQRIGRGPGTHSSRFAPRARRTTGIGCINACQYRGPRLAASWI